MSVLAHVAEHSRIIVEELNKTGRLPFELVWKPTLITNEVIRKTFNEANAGSGLRRRYHLDAHIFTGKNLDSGTYRNTESLFAICIPSLTRRFPYDTIDMDFMNENQSAHGGREYGHIVTRMGIERKVIVGHWADRKVQEQLASWMRTAVGVMEAAISV